MLSFLYGVAQIALGVAGGMVIMGILFGGDDGDDVVTVYDDGDDN